MKKLSRGTVLSLLALSIPAIAVAAEDKASKGVNAFRACYDSAPGNKVGAPALKINVVVDSQPDGGKATGKGTVTWASVGPSFKPIDAQISGPWYFMCTMKSCSIRFDFASAPGARGLKGMLVMPNWGAPGTFQYEFEGGSGQVEQKAAVCN